MAPVDIRIVKSKIRNDIKEYRKSLSPRDKEEMVRSILRRITSVPEYQEADLLLCYISTPIEVNTRPLVEDAWRRGKRVAAPYCIAGTRNMDFYLITSFDQLAVRTYGVWEPIADQCEKLTDISSGVCIVPALSYDLEGYRMGYGGGYYDRFLARFGGFKLGIVYDSCVRRRLAHGRYDLPVDLVVTDRRILHFPPRG